MQNTSAERNGSGNSGRNGAAGQTPTSTRSSTSTTLTHHPRIPPEASDALVNLLAQALAIVETHTRGPLAADCLCRIERAVILELFAAGRRLTLMPLRDLIEVRLGEPVSEGYMKVYLARLTAPEVAILTSEQHHRRDRPAGYALTDGRGLAIARHLAEGEVAK